MMPWSEFSFVLKPSELGGVGVFAAHDIPAGIRVFAGDTPPRRAKTKNIPPEFMKYCIFLNDEECLCPERFDRMEIGWYLNHSDKPNIAKEFGAREDRFVSLRDIQAGEEILMNYNQLNEPEYLKESYYRTSLD